ncbi:hypothetical protein [Salipaludibacillus agaradhaerens]|uniref:hypothetical protein n=1 Tax=Salipaludibacillus agaradhaerens TaxID=76935 RepID=UPI0009973ABD|nr:hypothetical protein [Salipaludibacillus agaradhaerens]
MSWYEILINIVIAIFTGLISGYIVSAYYRNREERERNNQEIHSFKQRLGRYLELISIELQAFIESDQGNEECEILKKSLIDPPVLRNDIEYENDEIRKAFKVLNELSTDLSSSPNHNIHYFEQLSKIRR